MYHEKGINNNASVDYSYLLADQWQMNMKKDLNLSIITEWIINTGTFCITGYIEILYTRVRKRMY